MQDQSPSNRWNFDYSSLSRRQTPRQSVGPDAGPGDSDGPVTSTQNLLAEPWNTDTRIELKDEELVFLEHYINVVAPILDLFDPLNHFASMVPHLALRNIGLLKSILAVGARHLALSQAHTDTSATILQVASGTPASMHSHSPNAVKFAEQYYFETLQYLSQNLLYQTYTGSREIVVTAIMISTYEMFGTAENPDHSAWDRHLRCVLLSLVSDIIADTHSGEPFGYNATPTPVASPPTVSGVLSGSPGYVKTYGRLSAQAARR